MFLKSKLFCWHYISPEFSSTTQTESHETLDTPSTLFTTEGFEYFLQSKVNQSRQCCPTPTGLSPPTLVLLNTERIKFGGSSSFTL